MTAEQARLRNWVVDKALSGDILVEQNIHCLDVVNWFLEAHPVKAFGTGGCKARTDVGDCWDHYVLTYWYPGGVKLDFTAMQFLKGGSRIFTTIYGTSETASAQYNGALSIAGDKPWAGGERDQTMRFTAILGRMAADRERVLTWEEMLRMDERLDGKIRE